MHPLRPVLLIKHPYGHCPVQGGQGAGARTARGAVYAWRRPGSLSSGKLVCEAA